MREIIAARQAQGDWTFAYVGVAPEKWARQMGLPSLSTADYDARSPRASFLAASAATAAYRGSGKRASQAFFEVRP